MISLWLSFYLAHALDLNLRPGGAWYGFPYIVTCTLCIAIESGLVIALIARRKAQQEEERWLP